MRQRRRYAAKNVRDSRDRRYRSRRCFQGRVALSVHRRAKPPVYKVGLVGGKGYTTHGGGSPTSQFRGKIFEMHIPGEIFIDITCIALQIHAHGPMHIVLRPNRQNDGEKPP